METDHLYQMLSKMDDKVNKLLVTTLENTIVLNDHKARSDRSEKRLDLLEDEYKKFRGFFSVGGWILGIAATIITVISKVTPLFK